ncbi:hypothetical protein BDD12DRAFT_920271, partial [Trichophaea hybrida]
QVLTWLYSRAYDTRHISIKDKRKEGTGNWLFEVAAFQEWKSGKTPLLWGHGIPGAGKTFLSSIVIDHLLAEVRFSNYGVAYIYFDYKEQNHQRPIDILCCIVKQLLAQLPPLLELPPKLLELYDTLRPAEKRPSLDELEAVLNATSKAFTRTFIICDAVDECDQEKQRERLLPLFRRLGDGGINLFLTSRPHPEDIQEAFEDVPQINITAHEEDLKSFIRERISKTSRAKKLIQGIKDKDQIISKVANSANGMFLLAHFYTEHLCRLTTKSQIWEALKQIENESTNERPLDLMYDRAVEDIRRKSRSEVELALKIFSWLTTARRTLTVDELRVAVSIERGKHELNYEEELPLTSTLLDVCASLVVIDRSTVRLAHYTVQEYLLRKENTMHQDLLPEKTIHSNADFELATSCIAYLSLDVFDEGPCVTEVSFVRRLEKHPLLDYASRNLHSHLKHCSEHLTTDEFLEFLGCQGKMSCYLQVTYSSAYSRYGHDWYPKGIRPIHIASRFGHKAAAQRLLQDPRNVSAVDNDGRIPLHMAAENGDVDMARVLDSRGVDVKVACKDGRTPLHMAADNGDIETVRFLQEKGADVWLKDNNGRVPLHMAAENGHCVVVQFLLENGADVIATDNHGWSP